MGQVISSASMSLDGYIAKDDNTIGRLFDWLQNGSVELPSASGDITFHMSPLSAEYWMRWVGGLGALVCGRTLFDFTGGGVAGLIAGQCLELGLLDAVAIDLVPVVMGTGRPYFGEVSVDDFCLGDPSACRQGDRVTHLVFPVTDRSSRGDG